MDLNITRFNMADIKFSNTHGPNGPLSSGPVIVLIGRRGTGKSFLVKDLLWYHRDIPVGTVISPTESANAFYSDIIPKIFIHDEYQEHIIENILKRQRAVTKEILKELKLYKRSTIDRRTFVILDDCLYDDKWTRQKWMRSIFMNGRHWAVCLIITIQYPLGIPPALRGNVDYTFILRDSSFTSRRKLYENYASMFQTFEMFCQVLDQTTNNRECMVVKNTNDSNRLSDQVFWYKAEMHPEFKLGSREFWEISRNLGDDNEDTFDPNKARKKSAGPIINVRKSTR